MKKQFAMLKRPLAMLLAVLMVLSAVNGAVVEVSAAATSVSTAQVLAHHYGLNEAEAEILKSEYVTLAEEIPYTAPDEQSGLVSVEDGQIVANVYEDGGNLWVPVMAEVNGEHGNEAVEFKLSDDIAATAAYTVEMPACAGESYEVNVTYRLYILEHSEDMLTLKNLPYNLVSDIAKMHTVRDLMDALQALCNELSITAAFFSDYDSDLEVLVALAEGIEHEGDKIMLDDCYNEIIYMQDQYDVNGMMDLVATLKDNDIDDAEGIQINELYLIRNCALTLAGSTTMVDGERLKTGAYLFKDAMKDIADAIENCNGYDYPEIEEGLIELVDVVAHIADCADTLAGNRSKNKWFMLANDYLAVESNDEYAAMNALLLDAMEQGTSVAVETLDAALNSGVETTFLGAEKVSAKITIHSEYACAGDWDKTGNVASENLTIYKKAGELTTAELEAMVKANADYTNAALAKIAAAGAYGEVNATNYALNWTFTYADKAVEEGKVVGQVDVTLSISPATFSVKTNYGADTTGRYGETFGPLGEHAEQTKEYTYIVNGKNYYQGESFVVLADTQIQRGEYSKAQTKTLADLILESSKLTEVEQGILSAEALALETFRLRYPNASYVLPEELVITNADCSVEAKDFETGLADGLNWTAVGGFVDYPEEDKTVGFENGKVSLGAPFHTIAATYELVFDGTEGVFTMEDVESVLDLPAVLLADYNEMLTTMLEQTSEQQMSALNRITPENMDFVGNQVAGFSGKDSEAYAAYEEIVDPKNLVDTDGDGKPDAIPCAMHMTEINKLLYGEDANNAAAMAYYYKHYDEIAPSFELVLKNVQIILDDKNLMDALDALPQFVEYKETLFDYVDLANSLELKPLNSMVDAQSEELLALMELLDAVEGDLTEYAEPETLTLKVELGAVAANEHTVTVVKKTDATCEQDGIAMDYYLCSHCGKSFADLACKVELTEKDIVVPAAHTEQSIPAVAATCTSTGLTEGKKCAVCGETLQKQEIIEMLDHTPADAVRENEKAATCGAAGSYDEVVYCSACKTEISRETKQVEKLPHTEETIPAVAATCSATGLTEGKKCSVCGEILIAQETVEKLAHTEEVMAAVAATCTATGLTEGKKCSVCGEVLIAQETVEKLAHTEEVLAAVEATCSATGLTEGKKCSVCGEILVAQETVEKLAHTEEVLAAVEATCTATGLTEGKKCSVCGEILVAQEVVPMTEHKYGVTGSLPSCTEPGMNGYSCMYCGDYYEVSYEPLGHEYEAVVTPATCTEKGYTTYTCVRENFGEVCGYTYVDDYTDMLPHTEEIIPGKAATETETGLTEGKKCSVCGEILKAQEVVDKLKPSHVHDYKAKVTAPTCTEKGYTTYTCSCGDSYKADEVAAKGHVWGKWTVEKTPTSKVTGLRTRKCSVCGGVDKEVLNKLSGKFTDVPESQYYALPVDWAVQKGVTTGMSATTFAPDDECTRAQIVTFLWRAAGKPEPESTKNPFVDVKKGDYFYEAVLWAVENGITTGTGENTFSPDSGCTRAQVATFLWRSQGKPAAAGKNPFVDVKKGEYFYDAVIWAVENGVTTGTSATTFAPEATCTRGQIVTFLYRAIA